MVARAVYALLAVFLLMSVTLTASFSLAQPGKLVTDELVANLSCSNLTANAIYKAIKPDAYAIWRRVDTPNYDQAYIGHCWALARWQRLGLLLGRQGDDRPAYDPVAISNLIRAREERLNVRFGIYLEAPLSSYYVFGWPNENLEVPKQISLFATDLKNARQYQASRTYLGDIHWSQSALFYRPKNLYYVFETQAQTERFKELNRIATLANSGRMPLADLRFKTRDQHVVLVRSAEKTGPTSWRFHYIDPNITYADLFFNVEKKDGKLTIDYFDSTTEIRHPDIYLVSEDERPLLDKALVAHYQKLCR